MALDAARVPLRVRPVPRTDRRRTGRRVSAPRRPRGSPRPRPSALQGCSRLCGAPRGTAPRGGRPRRHGCLPGCPLPWARPSWESPPRGLRLLSREAPAPAPRPPRALHGPARRASACRLPPGAHHLGAWAAPRLGPGQEPPGGSLWAPVTPRGLGQVGDPLPQPPGGQPCHRVPEQVPVQVSRKALGGGGHAPKWVVPA